MRPAAHERQWPTSQHQRLITEDVLVRVSVKILFQYALSEKPVIKVSELIHHGMYEGVISNDLQHFYVIQGI